jgi:hypothetical protein
MRIRHFLGDFARACKVMRILHQMKLTGSLSYSVVACSFLVGHCDYWSWWWLGRLELGSDVNNNEGNVSILKRPAGGRAGQNQLSNCPAEAAVRGAAGRDHRGGAWPAAHPGCWRRPPPPAGPARPGDPAPPGGLPR